MLDNTELLDKRQGTGKEVGGNGQGVTNSGEFGFNLS
jgi:hypothetical protein